MHTGLEGKQVGRQEGKHTDRQSHMHPHDFIGDPQALVLGHVSVNT